MLTLIIPSVDIFNDITNEFGKTKEYTLQLEHSLVSLSKWESKWCKPFLDKSEKTHEESIDYIRCMTITTNVDPDAYNHITNDNIQQVTDYIEAPMTATTFAQNDKKSINREIVTNEIIYYWMVAFQIPFQCEKWHLNRLLTLINVCNVKNQPTKKMPVKDIYAKQRELNAMRRKQLNTTG